RGAPGRPGRRAPRWAVRTAPPQGPVVRRRAGPVGHAFANGHILLARRVGAEPRALSRRHRARIPRVLPRMTLVRSLVVRRPRFEELRSSLHEPVRRVGAVDKHRRRFRVPSMWASLRGGEYLQSELQYNGVVAAEGSRPMSVRTT